MQEDSLLVRSNIHVNHALSRIFKARNRTASTLGAGSGGRINGYIIDVISVISQLMKGDHGRDHGTMVVTVAPEEL